MINCLYWMVCLVLLALFCPSALAAPAASRADTRFVAIAFHDITSPGEPEDTDSISVDSLVGLFEWLKHDGWNPVSTADIDAANKGLRPLPPKAILLTFDDGYASVYSRVYPLLLAYRYPAVVALVGEWMDTPAGEPVDYGGRPMPREHFLTWDQVRRMQASGLVEIASHSYGLHEAVAISSHGALAPSGRAWLFDPARGAVETDEEHRQRIRADLVRSRDAIARETGRAPHVLVWPFGRYSGLGLQEARAAGFDQIFTLEPAAADAGRPLEMPRYYPMRDPELGEILENLRFAPARSAIRAACVDLSAIAAARDATKQDALLGRMIEELRALGANVAIVELASAGREIAADTRLLEAEADFLSQAARQLGSRAGVDVYVQVPMPHGADEQEVIALAQDVARAAPITGLALGDVSRLPQIMRVMQGAREIDPLLRLLLLTGLEGVTPPDGVHLAMWPRAAGIAQARAHAASLAADGWFATAKEDQVLLTLPQAEPAEQVRAIRAMQGQGATALALCPWDPAQTAALAPAFSAATFPRRP